MTAERPVDSAAGGGTTACTDTPDVELRRQRAVESLNLSEDQPVERLDRITRLARTVFGVPIAAVTILDGDRAWFPSEQGLGVSEMPREQTFCDTTQGDGELLLVPDATADPRFDRLDVVTSGAVTFYAGRPLRDHLGNVVGSFCIFDDHARDLTAEQRVTFEDLAVWAEQELVASNEMVQAGRVQASLLPAQALATEGWSADGICLPALAVGGDFFDFRVTNDVLHLDLGDVMGKGTGAALVGAGTRAALRGTHAAVTAGVDLGITATQVARSLVPDLERAESFVTLFEAAVDLDDGYLRWVDAGSGLGLVVRADGTTEQLSSEDRPFGVLPDDHWTEHTDHLRPGDRLVVFSDGLLDLVDDPLDWVAPIAAMIAESADVRDLLGRIEQLTVARTPLDDVTALAVFRSPAGGAA